MMEKNPLNDKNRRAADTTKSVHLSASAGSGKTRALKERFLALLNVLDRRGLNIDQAIAITFTDKAAAEIKERVMRDLPEDMLKKIIRGRQDLRISTIHSFCMNLLKRYPLEAGLPPDFGILDSRDRAAKVRKAVEDALEASDRDDRLMAPLMEFSSDELIARMEHLISIRSKLKRLEIDSGGAEGLVRALQNGLAVERTEAELQEMVNGSDWSRQFLEMEQILKAQVDFYTACLAPEHALLARARDIDAAAPLADALATVYFNKNASPSKRCAIAKSRYIGRNRDEYEKKFFCIQELLLQFRTGLGRLRSGKESTSLLRLFLASDRNYEFAKRREGLLDFDDLEIYAYRLLRGAGAPDILYWLDRKILHFLVDEFQDTSDIQWAILNTLTEEIFAGQGADKPLPPTLFVVGDKKQSIYRFREANHRLIDDVGKKMETNLLPGSREILTLGRNYRSTLEVIETVNSVFRALWGDDYQASDVERREQTGSVSYIELGPRQEGAPEVPTEAETLAREIRNMIAAGTTVYDRTTDAGGTGAWTKRNAGYGDCVILIQSRTKLKEYETALRAAHVPYKVVGGIGFYDEDEIQALMNVLFFLWNREDKLALAGALKSRLFGLSDHDLYDLLRDEAGLEHRLRQDHPEKAELLREWADLAGLVPLSVLLHRIVTDTGAYIRFGKGNPQALFNIDKLLDTAREFDRRGYTTLQDFVEWVRNVRRTELREATADMNLPGFEGAVSIMTVHKAKGLEYPIVFLPGMNQQTRSLTTGPLAIVEENRGMLRMAVKDAANPVYDELWDTEHEELLQEHQRLLYVAMTRARDRLVMIGSMNNSGGPVKENTWSAYLRNTAPQPLMSQPAGAGPGIVYYSWPSPVPEQYREPAHAGTGASGPVPSRVPDIKNVLKNNLASIDRSEAPEWKKATDFIVKQEGGASIYPAATTPVSPLLRGSVLHRCLEDFTKKGVFDPGSVLDEFDDALSISAAVRTGFLQDCEAVMNTVLNTPHHAWIFDPRLQSYSELPFLMKKGQSIVSGVVDRIVIRDGVGIVVDYKAIPVNNNREEKAWLDHYRPQVQIYCEAIKEMFNLPAVEGYLLFLDSNTLSLCSKL